MASPQEIPGLERRREPPVMREDPLEERIQRELWGVVREAGGTAALAGAGLSKKVANALMLARFFESEPGLAAAAEEALRKDAEQIERGVRENTRGEEASGVQKAAQVLGGLPLGVAEAAIAVETGGVIPGLTGLSALSEADKGPEAAAKAALEALPMALVFKGLHAAPPMSRAPIVGGATALFSQEEDPVKRATEALAMGATAAITPRVPRAVRPVTEARIPVEGLELPPPPGPGAPPSPAPPGPPGPPAAAQPQLIGQVRQRLNLPPEPGAHAAPVRIEGRPEPLESQYELVEADSIKASHDAMTFSPRPDYGAKQERNYQGDKNEQAKVIRGADAFNPAEVLNNAPNAITGPPIVDAGGNAWAGNGRKMMMDRVYAGAAKTAPEVLKGAVVEAAPRFGLDAGAAARMQKPIIVRRLAQSEVPTSPEAGLSLSRELNIDVTNAADMRTRAQSQAAALDRGLDAFADAVKSAGEDAPTVRAALESGPSARRFAEALQADGIIPPTARANWLTPDGLLTKHGVDQAEQLLLARVLPERELVDAAPAELRNKVLRSVPSILQVERAAPGSLAPLVADVVRSEIARSNAAGSLSIEEFNAQRALDASLEAPSQRDPRVAALQKLIVEGRPTQVSRQLGALRRRVEDISGGQPDLMTGRVPTIEEAFAEVLGVPAQGSIASASERPTLPSKASEADGISRTRQTGSAPSGTGPQVSVRESQSSTETGPSGRPEALIRNTSPSPPQRTPSTSPARGVFDSIDPISKKNMIQDFDNVEAILGVAAVREPPLRATLAEVATVSPTAELYGTRIKSVERVNEKLARNPRAPGTIGDYLGGRIIYDRLADANTLEARFNETAAREGWQVIERELHDGPVWHGTHLQVYDPRAGISFEVQLIPREMHEVGAQHHKLYERVQNKLATDAEVIELQRLFSEAWERFLARQTVASATSRAAAPAGGGAGAPPAQPRAPPSGAALPPPPPPSTPAPAAPPPRRGPPTSSAEFYQRLAEKRGAELRRARGLADEAARDVAAPFRQAKGTPLDRPAELRTEEVSALLQELLKRRGSPEAAVDELLSRNDFDTLEHADVLLPSITRFYAQHAEVARRGVVKDQVLRELAQMEGLTEKQLLRRMIGEAPNAETLLAMKDIVQRKLDRVNELLDELADPATASPQKELAFANEHKVLGLLWAQFRGATAEAGRALRATQLSANADRARGGRLSLEDLKEIYDQSHGGVDNVKLLIEQLQTLRHTPAQLRAHLRKTYTATRWDQFMFAYRAVLLSGGRTLARNFFGNLGLLAKSPVERTVGATVGRALELLPINRVRIPLPGAKTDLVNIAIRERAPDVSQSRPLEGFALTYGMLSAGRAAVRLYWDTVFGPAPEGAGVVRRAFSLPRRFLFNEELAGDARSTERMSSANPIEGKLGALIGTPFRQLEAWDVAFRHPHRVGELTALAYREAAKQNLQTSREVLEFIREFTLDPPEWAWKQAEAHARELTLTEPLGRKGRAFSQFVNSNPVLQFLVPFTRVPVNMWKVIGRNSPLGFGMSDVRAQLARGGAERDRAIGQMLVGSAILTYAALLARQGLITGAGPSDPDQRRIKRETGWKPYHIRIGDEYYSIRGAEPISTQLGIVADLVDASDELSEEAAGTIASQLALSTVRNMADQSMMAGIAGVLEAIALHDAESLDRFFARSAAGVLVPRALEGPTQAVKAIGGELAGEPDERPWRADPYLRETRGLMDDVLVRLGMSEAELEALGRDRLPPRTGFWGQPLPKPEIIGPDWLSPFTKSPASDDPVTAELYRLVVARKNGLPGLPAYEDVPDHIGNRKLGPREHWEFKQGRRNAKLELDRIVASDRWKQIEAIPDAATRDLVKSEIFDAVIRGYQEVARAEMLGSLNEADRLKAAMDDKTTRLLRAQGRLP